MVLFRQLRSKSPSLSTLSCITCFLFPALCFSTFSSALIMGMNRNKTQTVVTSTCMTLNKCRTKTGIFFNDSAFRMSQHTSSESLKNISVLVLRLFSLMLVTRVNILFLSKRCWPNTSGYE